MSVFEEPERRLIGRVGERSRIYRNALSPRLLGELRDALTDYFECGLIAHLKRHPEIAPKLPAGVSPGEQLRMRVAQAASGTVGAIEAWLGSGSSGAVEDAARVVLVASPEWWLGRNAAVSHSDNDAPPSRQKKL